MKKLSIFLSVIVITGLCFVLLISISEGNQYTSVRKYTKPKKGIISVIPDISPQKEKRNIMKPTMEKTNITSVVQENPPIEPQKNPPKAGIDTTPPVIEFLNYTDGDIVSASTIDIQVKVTDNISSSDKIRIEGTGIQTLKSNFNPIVVTATDEAGNTISAYIIIEKQ